MYNTCVWPQIGRFTANDKLRFVVNVFTLPVCPCLGLKIRGWQFAAVMFVFLHLLISILAEKLSLITFFWKRIRWSISKTVLKSRISSQTWDCDVLGCKKPCGKSLTSGAWSSRTNVNLKPRTWRQGPGHVTSWCSRFAGNAEKPQSEATSFPGFCPTCANESNIVELCFGDQGKREMEGVVGLKVWPVSNLVQQLATTCNRVYKRTQHVASNNDGSCLPTMMCQFTFRYYFCQCLFLGKTKRIQPKEGKQCCSK